MSKPSRGRALLGVSAPEGKAFARRLAACLAHSGSDFRAVTRDYATEGSLCMCVKICDVVVAGAGVDCKDYIFALDAFNDKSCYIPLSAASAIARSHARMYHGGVLVVSQ